MCRTGFDIFTYVDMSASSITRLSPAKPAHPLTERQARFGAGAWSAVASTLVPVACCAPLAAAALSAEQAEATSELFKALADPARVRIVNLIAVAGEPVCACNLTGPVGLSQPTVSHHLKKLVDVGLLEREQRGKWAYFSLRRAAVDKLAAVADLKGACCI